jgi:hypothetical protein
VLSTATGSDGLSRLIALKTQKSEARAKDKNSQD